MCPKVVDVRYLSNFELRQICYFLAVVEAGNNFSKAAEQLDIEQPPLSQRIRSLEKALSVELFNRRTRPLRLTPAGQAFLEEASLALNHLERAIDNAQLVSRGEIGRLIVGINSGIANSLLPDILRTFRQRFPKVELVLRELTGEQQIQEMRNYQVDVGFEHLPNHYEQATDLCFLPFLQDSLLIALPENHHLAAQSQIPLEALAQEPFVIPSLKNAPSLYTETINLCKNAGFLPQIAQEATWMITVLSLIAGGIGVALLSSNVRTLHRAGVVYRNIQGANLNRQIAALWRQGDENISPVLCEFLQVIAEVASENSKYNL
ncbi:MAG: LysR family transcriptional regulator [Desmonostoc vinosum HA7617-LM4]|jgi:DNA-binding transcriptional LysR family regulator|nr:LysR family transcriptional regulator [Desmonostoc vinosum HA7617-LM4]